jgi:RNA polymerase sigma-70 factor (ECF subfamily)
MLTSRSPQLSYLTARTGGLSGGGQMQPAAYEMPTRSDQELARASIDGDRRAFGELVDSYQTRIFNLALRVTGHTEDAMDVTQTAFLKVYENLERFDAGRPFSSWIYRIALNEALTLVGRRRSAALEIEPESPDRTPERKAESRETTRAVQEALLELTPEHRAMIVLRHFEGLSYEEMSQITGIPGKTVKSRLFTARQKLRSLLERRRLL